MLVIMNADDLGANPCVNDAIFQMMGAQRVTSATLLANGPFLRQAYKNIRDFPHCSFGVHLNVTEYEPLASTEHLRVLLDDDGCFSGEDRLRKMRMTPRLAHAIYVEFCAQIERLISLGVRVSHIDSHHHVHTLPKMFPLLKRFQRKYGLRKVRISRNMYPDDSGVSSSLLLKKHIYNFMLRNCFRTKTTSLFTDLMTLCNNGDLSKCRQKTCEIMVHPGAPDSEEETALLHSPWQEQAGVNFKLINYNEL